MNCSPSGVALDQVGALLVLTLGNLDILEVHVA
jgi:hypothetical protein